MFVIGITGGVASGKSTVISVLASMDVITVNADIIGHKTYQQGTNCYKKLVENFTEAIVQITEILIGENWVEWSFQTAQKWRC